MKLKPGLGRLYFAQSRQ